MSTITKKRRLRIATHMCPSHPVQLYELIMEMLEESLDCHATLIYESRCAEKLRVRENPFESDEIDLAFISPAAYMKMKKSKITHAELLLVSPVFTHPKNVNNELGYYADLIVHKDKLAHNVLTMQDLRGSTFAYSDEESLSGSEVVLKALHDAGENATFFGNALKSGSHLASAQMVLSKQAEWASVDATCLLYSKKYMQDGGKDISVLKSIGPLPPYPIVVNSRLPDDFKKKLTEVFLNLPLNGDWKKRFEKYGVVKFLPNGEYIYEREQDEKGDQTKRGKINVRYY